MLTGMWFLLGVALAVAVWVWCLWRLFRKL
jgi:hypothetical protein